MIRHNSSFPAFGGRPPYGAFSLIELLAVITLLSVLAVATVPALRGTLDGINISGAADMTKSEILLARQTAITRNLPVEIRFYKHDNGSGEAWSVIALVIPSTYSGRSTDEWITSGKALPDGVVIDDSHAYSTVLSEATSPPVGGNPPAPWTAMESSNAPSLVRKKNFVGFLFNPDGSTNLPGNKPWCLSIKRMNSKPAAGAPAENFVSFVLDSLTGKVASVQP